MMTISEIAALMLQVYPEQSIGLVVLDKGLELETSVYSIQRLLYKVCGLYVDKRLNIVVSEGDFLAIKNYLGK